MNSPVQPSPATLSELRDVPILEGLPDDVLEWILEVGRVVEYQDGEVLVRTGEPIDHLWLVLDGSSEFHMDMKGRLVRWVTFGKDPPARGASGLIPYSRMKGSIGWAYARGRLRMLAVHKDDFREMEDRSPELIQRLIATMTERARVFATRQIQEEKISALGKLAAGLAHELNNPAAAIQRTVGDLERRLDQNYEYTAGLLDSGIQAGDLQTIRDIIADAAKPAGDAPMGLSERMSVEDQLSGRLKDLGVARPDEFAETLVDAGVSVDAVDRIHEAVGPERFPSLTPWLCNVLLCRKVMQETAEASSRISTLVGAIKSHVYMDRTTTRQAVSIHRGIEDTLTILNHKLRGKNIQVERRFQEGLPDILGYGGELNQAWTNLIDNGIDAVSDGGRLTITTSSRGNEVHVKVADDGKGIPKEIMGQIFDPFFTTKSQGEGTGIGLDIVRQVVERHRGEVRVTSKPGRTEFHVHLPLTPEDGRPRQVGEGSG